MRTPGHAVVNLLLLSPASHGSAIVLGAIAPDFPIALLYAHERYIRRTPEERIWTEAYQRAPWKAVIHGTHSIPLVLAAGAVAVGCSAVWLSVFFVSMLLHALADFPVHAEDAHRHFFPLSNWRFISPISYWDVRYHGRAVAAVEAVVVSVAAAILGVHMSTPGRLALAAVSCWYFYGYWRTFVRDSGRWQPYF